MAAGPITLAQLATINNRNLSGAIADELTEAAPLFMAMFAQVASQANVHQWLRYNDPPPVGFRDLNTGRDQGSTTDTNVTVALSILDATSTMDVASGTGHILGTDALLAIEGTRHLRTAFAKAEQQIIYGVGADAAGFAGLTDNPRHDSLSDEMVLDGGGSTASMQSSVWLLRSDFSNISIVTGNNGDIQVGESIKQSVLDGSSKPYTAWVTPAHAWYALQDGGRFSSARIANVENALTDDNILEAISRFPVDRQPNIVAMNRRSAMLLRQSRTATSPTGAFAPWVSDTEAMTGGRVQIIVTDQINSTEAVVA